MVTTALESLESRVAALFASDPEAMRDPFPLWAELRHTEPLFEFGGATLVTRYDDVKTVLRDDQRFSSVSGLRGSRVETIRASLTPEQQRAFGELADFQGRFVVSLDKPEHTRAREIMHRAFTPRRIAELEASAQRYLDELLAPIAAAGGGDLMALAYRLPLMVICDLLCIPQADREQIHEWSSIIGRNRDGGDPDPRPMMAAHGATMAFRDYVEELIDGRATSSEPSLLVDALMSAAQGDRMTREETAVSFVILLFAGHETTTNLIGNGIFELLRRPDQWNVLTEDPGRARTATEELLRFVTPVQWINRRTSVEVELGGTVIPSDHTVLPVIAAANRDPAVFRDPDALDLLRPDSRNHLALGFGTHYCLGASLARLEGTLAFRALAARFPQMTLTADPDELRWRSHAKLRSLETLPVELGPERAA